MNKRKISIIINVLIVLFETFALVKSYNFDHRIMFEYYTVDSNLLALFSSLLYLICIIGEKKVNKFVRLFKYVTTVGLTITFVVVLVILLPMVGFNFNYLLFQGAMPYHHLICPILSTVKLVPLVITVISPSAVMFLICVFPPNSTSISPSLETILQTSFV